MIYTNPIFSGSINVSGSLNLNGQPLTISLVPIYGDTTPKVLNSTSSIQTLTVTGENFDGTAIGYVKGNNGTRYDPTTSIRNSDVQLTLNFSGSDRLTSANEPYDIYILNGNGENTFEENVVNVDASPIWQTPAGNLGAVLAGRYLTSSINISATDPDSNDTVSYFITGGALPAGMALITSSGELTGSSIIPLDIENYNESGIVNNVTIAATDNTSTVIRNFAITKKWVQDGSTVELAAPSAIDLVNLGLTTNGIYWIKPSGYTNSAFQVYCDLDGTASSITGTTGWMRVEYSQNYYSRASPWTNQGADPIGPVSTEFTFNLTLPQIQAMLDNASEARTNFHSEGQGSVGFTYQGVSAKIREYNTINKWFDGTGVTASPGSATDYWPSGVDYSFTDINTFNNTGTDPTDQNDAVWRMSEIFIRDTNAQYLPIRQMSNADVDGPTEQRHYPFVTQGSYTWIR